jgi:NAD(P)-dependent dehydrogenase (short-subunit alcohol dehydrogenase family)
MLIATGTMNAEVLEGRVVVVSGAGSGIGFEAGRSLLWLGAKVVIAEIDASTGRAAAATLHDQFPASDVVFIQTDVGSAESIDNMVAEVSQRLGAIDVVCNNATIAPHGHEVWRTPISDWDSSYAVNLRGPVLMARACLPGMVERGRGIFVCVSSTGGPYLAAYETFKTAQVELAKTLDAELAGTGVVAFTIGPGLVPTATAAAAVEVIAPKLGLGLDEFYAMNRGALLSVEAAGAGFAAAIALADRYAGQEISSAQALIDAGIAIPEELALPEGVTLPEAQDDSQPPTVDWAAAAELCGRVRSTLAEQHAGWRERSFFERQWMLRDFKGRAGMPVERWLERLERLEADLLARRRGDMPPLERLVAFYANLAVLARGYIKDPAAREEQLAEVDGWRTEAEQLKSQLDGNGPSAGPGIHRLQ